MTLIAYVVKKPDEPLQLSKLRRDRHSAWRMYLQSAEPDVKRLSREAREACSMEGVRLHCFAVVPSGTFNDL